MKKLFLITSMLFCALVAGAQSNIVSELQRDVQGEGTVRITQP